MPIKLSNNEKVEILRQILPQFWNEAVHWREDSWRFTTWMVTAFILIAGVSTYTDKGLTFAFWILSALTVGGIIYLVKNYFSYKDRIRLFLQVEEALLFFDDNVYIKDRSLLPKDHRNLRITLLGQGIYMIILLVIAAASLYSVAHQAGYI